MNSTKWHRYPDEKPRFAGHYFVTYVVDGKPVTNQAKFLSSAQFDCEIWGRNVLSWMQIEMPAPDPHVVAEIKNGEE